MLALSCQTAMVIFVSGPQRRLLNPNFTASADPLALHSGGSSTDTGHLRSLLTARGNASRLTRMVHSMDGATATATITVLGISPVRAGRLVALADVALVLDGVEVVIHGVQVRADAGQTEVTLPTYRCPSGEWRPAVTLPEEVRGPMGDAVMVAGLEAGLLREKAAGNSEPSVV